MALDTAGFEAALVSYWTSMSTTEKSIADQAHDFAVIVETYIKTGTVSGSGTASAVQSGGGTAPVSIVSLPIT